MGNTYKLLWKFSHLKFSLLFILATFASTVFEIACYRRESVISRVLAQDDRNRISLGYERIGCVIRWIQKCKLHLNEKVYTRIITDNNTGVLPFFMSKYICCKHSIYVDTYQQSKVQKKKTLQKG